LEEADGGAVRAPLLPTTDRLAIYLNDHLAGATTGRELARRCARANRGTALGGFLEDLVREIEEDREELVRIMDRLGVGTDYPKVAAGWVGEKVGRLKLNGQLTGYSPLSRLLELEGLIAGVHGKLGLWRALREIAPGDGRLDEPSLDGLIVRAEAQLSGLRDQHARAASEALRAR
jgi:hypothetical protein